MTNREAIEILKAVIDMAISELQAQEAKTQLSDPEPHSERRLYLEGYEDGFEAGHKERKKGRWIPQNHNKTNGMVSTLVSYCPKCSECGHSGNYDMNFCPNCGADNREDTDAV